MYGTLDGFTTLGIGGKADITVISETAQLAGIKHPAVIGRGSNLLISDDGVAGNVVVMRTSEFKIEGESITADSGVMLPVLAQAAAARGLSGLEWACGIPGSLGGGVMTNAGAFSGSISDILESVTVYGIGEIGREDILMSYRHTSGIGGVITKIKLRLRQGDKGEIKSRMREYAYRRSSTQPKGRSAGSSFKGGEKAAGWYIDNAGLKGLRRGGADISEKHANFIINNGGATAADIRFLLNICKIKVKRTYGVSLEEEIIYLGEF